MAASGLLDGSADSGSPCGSSGSVPESKEATAPALVLSFRVLALLGQGLGLVNAAREILRMVKDFTGCEAAGIRLREDEGLPYLVHEGFSLSAPGADGFPCILTAAGEADLSVETDSAVACACSAVMSGLADPSLRCFTASGSFWINNIPAVVSASSEKAMFSPKGSRCLAQGYRSVALIPLRSNEAVIGVLQLGDSAEGFFSAQQIGLLEEIGTCAGIVLERLSADEAMTEATAELEARFQERTAELRQVREMLVDERAERQEIERALEATETRYRTLVENAGDVIWCINRDMRFSYVSPSVTSVLGYAVDEILNLDPLDLMPPFSREPFLNMCRETLELQDDRTTHSSASRTQEIEGFHKDGSTRWLEVGATALTEAGRPVGILAVARDITDRKRIEQAKADFLTTAAHELRGPLTSILGYSELLLIKDDLSPEEKERCLTRINDQAGHLARLVTTLLEISHLESGEEWTLNLSRRRVDEVIRAVIKRFRQQNTSRQVDVTLTDNLPEFFLDERALTEVLQRILTNAAVYSPQGSPIGVTCAATGDQCEIAIQDRGIGMTAEQIERLFDKFYRGDSSNKATPGLGLGMTVVKRIVEAMGGRVKVESEYGQGTTVTFTLPIRRADAVAGGSASEENTDR
ncbi:MAG: PAS domain S-box protein [Desulfomonile tiedjei]|nr:PAS domain S-box protein [Desulfomonile tiedjei]